MLGYFQTRSAKRRDSSAVATTEDTLHPHRTVRGERVAIIDDEEVMTSVTSAVLQRLGYSTVSYSSAARFVKAFNADPEHVDLVVTDVVMPGISGVQLVRLLRDVVTADELDKAREGYLQSMKVGRSSDAALGGSLGGLRYLGRTMLWEADFEK